MHMILIRSYIEKLNLIEICYIQTHILQNQVNLKVYH